MLSEVSSLFCTSRKSFGDHFIHPKAIIRMPHPTEVDKRGLMVWLGSHEEARMPFYQFLPPIISFWFRNYARDRSWKETSEMFPSPTSPAITPTCCVPLSVLPSWAHPLEHWSLAGVAHQHLVRYHCISVLQCLNHKICLFSWIMGFLRASVPDSQIRTSHRQRYGTWVTASSAPEGWRPHGWCLMGPLILPWNEPAETGKLGWWLIVGKGGSKIQEYIFPQAKKEKNKIKSGSILAPCPATQNKGKGSGCWWLPGLALSWHFRNSTVVGVSMLLGTAGVAMSTGFWNTAGWLWVDGCAPWAKDLKAHFAVPICICFWNQESSSTGMAGCDCHVSVPRLLADQQNP